MPSVRLSVLVFILWLNIPAPLLAQKTYAVIIGISDYALFGPKNGDLNFADDDARLFASFLTSQAGGSVPTGNIILLTDRQATRKNILLALALFRQATSQDRIIFFFSGHGDHGILLPYDASPGVLLYHDDVKKAFRQSIAHTKFLLADACKSGSMSRKTVHRRATTNDLNVLVFMSSRANQLSQEVPGLHHGAFSYFLVKGASGLADENNNKEVSIRELYKFMRVSIQTITGNKQTPVIFGKFDESKPFAFIHS